MTEASRQTESRPRKRGEDPRPMTPAIEAALTRHYRDFRRYLTRRTGNAAIAEDVLQEFCMRVMRSGTSLRNDESAVAWLYTVLRSVLTDHYRKQASQRRGTQRYIQDQIVLNEPYAETDESEGSCDCVRSVLPELRPDYSEILRRVHLSEEDRPSVAARLGISPTNLRVRLHRALSAMRKALIVHCGDCCQEGYRDCYCARICTLGPEQADAGILRP